MLELSLDKKIRKGQLRSLAKEAMSKNAWSGGDPIAKVVSLLESAYATGMAVASGPVTERDTEEAVPWNAIPERAREILKYTIMYRASWNEIIAGRRVLLLDGAQGRVPRGTRDETTWLPRGARTRMGLWEVRGDKIHQMDDIGMDWAASSASALLRLGLFEEYGECSRPSAAITTLGIRTVEAAIADESIAR
jgi:hypothetical protein